MKNKSIIFLFFSLGFFSLLAQTLIIREFIISFGGNELGIALFYFFWLLWVGIGTIAAFGCSGKFFNRHFLKITTLYPILAFFEMLLFINLKSAAGLPWWEFFSLEKVFIYLFFFTSLISFFTGLIFSEGAMWLKKAKDTASTKIISVSYISEALGSFFAGIAVTLLLMKLTNTFVIIILGGILFSLSALLVSICFKEKISSIANTLILIFFLIAVINQQKIILFSNNLRLNSLLPQGKFIKEINTPYQNILLGKLPSQTVCLSNGQILNTIPEVIDADRESALFTAMARSPKRILIFGYGVENIIHSLLQFPVQNITYCIEDKIYYDEIQKILPSEIKKSLNDRRLEVIFKSSRLFLKENEEKFDLVIVYTPDPANLIINTFWTQEFYASVKNNLNQNGIIAAKITSAENYVGEEIKNYGSSLYHTMKTVFPQIIITPGEISWFFAGSPSSPLTSDPLILEERLKSNLPPSFSFFPEGFRSIFLKERVEFIKNIYSGNSLFQNEKLLNSDIKPLTFFLNLLVMARYSDSYFIKFLKNAFFAGITIFIIPLLILFFLRIHFIFKVENKKSRRIIFNSKLFQFLSGFLGLSFHITLIFLFQNRFGMIFQFIGLVNALFMLGLCIGAVLGAFIIKAGRHKKETFLGQSIISIIFIQIICCLASIPIFINVTFPQTTTFFLYLIFFLITGILTGSSYPLSAKILETNNIGLRPMASQLELLDHWGGSLAGLLTGLLMIPLLGTVNTIFVISFIAFLLLIIFSLELVPDKLILKKQEHFKLSFPYISASYILIGVSLSFIVVFNLLEKEKNLWQGKHPILLKMLNDTCIEQNSPFPAYRCGKEEIEYILESKNFASHIKGMFGPINILLKTDSQQNIKQIEIIEHRENPFYVNAVNINKFLEQFKGISLNGGISLIEPSKINKLLPSPQRGEGRVRGIIDAISGATITSKAIVNIINETGIKLEGGSKIQEKQTSRIVIDTPSLLLIFFTITAVFLYISPHYFITRKIYLVLAVIFLGFFTNTTFSFFHLNNLVTFNLPSFAFLSQIILYLIPLFLGIFFGQLWCGWICPFGALQEILPSIFGKRLPLKVSASLDKKARYFKYIFLAFFIVIISIRRDAAIFKQEPLSIFFLNPLNIFKDKLLSLIILFFSLFFLRFWCRYFCICGAFFSFFNKIFILRKFFVKKYKNCPFGVEGPYDIDCIQCNICMAKQ